jgi:hypothetical protein
MEAIRSSETSVLQQSYSVTSQKAAFFIANITFRVLYVFPSSGEGRKTTGQLGSSPNLRTLTHPASKRCFLIFRVSHVGQMP